MSGGDVNLGHGRARPAGARPPGAPQTGERRMPDFVRPRRGARHSLDTALRALRALGVDDAQIAVESVGLGWAPGSIVRQQPAPGTPLGSAARVTIAVADVGALDALPYALRDVDDATFGVDALVALLDSPVHHLRHHLRSGGDFFALRAGDPVSARRWIEYVFQLDPSPWAPERWPAIARLLPALHRVAGREDGLALGLEQVFGLPLASVAVEAEVVRAAPRGRLTLGTSASRLGVDTLLGEGRAEVARLALTLGPVTLDTYLAHQGAALAAQRRALYTVLAPLSLAERVVERWIVGDPLVPARLGGSADVRPGAAPSSSDAATQPAALGLTTRLG